MSVVLCLKLRPSEIFSLTFWHIHGHCCSSSFIYAAIPRRNHFTANFIIFWHLKSFSLFFFFMFPECYWFQSVIKSTTALELSSQHPQSCLQLQFEDTQHPHLASISIPQLCTLSPSHIQSFKNKNESFSKCHPLEIQYQFYWAK